MILVVEHALSLQLATGAWAFYSIVDNGDASPKQIDRFLSTYTNYVSSEKIII